jgi:hypothetical protein
MIDISTGNYRKNTCEKNEIHIEGKYHDWIEKRNNNNIICSVQILLVIYFNKSAWG